MLRRRTAPDASPEAVERISEARKDRSPIAKRALPLLRTKAKMHSKSRGYKMVAAANKKKEKSPMQAAKSQLPLVPSTPVKGRDSKPPQLIQYGKEKPNNNVQALFKRRKEQQENISGFRGMENLGNTCYMNAVLQVLTSLDTFTTDMQSEQLLSAPLPEDGVCKALLQVIKEKKLAGMDRLINPVALKRSVAKNSMRFEGARQQDAHEFLCNLLDQVQEEVFTHYEKKLLPQDSSKLQLQDTRCPTSLSFSCIVEHELVCDSCGESSEVRELFRHLSLDIPEGSSPSKTPPNLQQLLELYFKDEPLEKTCEKCGCLTCTVKHRVRRLPRVLVLHMKRFCVKIDGPVQRYVKRKDPVRIDSILDLGPVCGFTTKGPIPFGDQVHSSPSQNKASKTPLSPRRTLADVSNTWQAVDSPVRRASISASSGAPGRIRGGCSVALDSELDATQEADRCSEDAREAGVEERSMQRGGCSREDDATCSMDVEDFDPEAGMLRGGGQDSDPYALEDETVSDLLQKGAAERGGLASSRVVSKGSTGVKRKHNSIYTRASQFETENPLESFKKLPPGARFDSKNVLQAQQRKSPVTAKKGFATVRKFGDKISTKKNLFKTTSEKRAEEHASFLSPKKAKTADAKSSLLPQTIELPAEDEDAELARALAESAQEFEANGEVVVADVAGTAAVVSKEQEQLDRAIALSLQEAAAVQSEELRTPPTTDHPAPASPAVEIADDAESADSVEKPFSTVYKLHGIISHLGTLASSGHFIADVFDVASEQWVRHDDSVVKVVPRSTVLNERREVDGYIFFYVHEPLVQQQKLEYRQRKESGKQNLEDRFL